MNYSFTEQKYTESVKMKRKKKEKRQRQRMKQIFLG